MKRLSLFSILAFIFLISFGCGNPGSNIEANQAIKVQQQQSQYDKGQPLPFFNWSLERDLIIKLYNVRNKKVSTHSVWRSDRGLIEGDCTSYGYGLPYDTSLTNPLTLNNQYVSAGHGWMTGVIEQAEPNGIFASKATAATWVMCLGKAGTIEPVYVETKVTVYPGPVKVNYETNRVIRFGDATVIISK